ncbi:EspA/EspE family type VII secretion system effector [Actinokineospora pegani]|uniref:EspA/EspE family type VII secretion system effector n=1 Tax=Actinokineospora pegani TaxID=2654637 RepID=UPI0012EAC82F|nr:EspA/EspE family type VII secretion system effector [Actinokineospora pegani]
MTTTTTTTASGNRTAEQGAQNIAADIDGVKASIERGDWLEAGLGATNVAMDIIGIAGDPLQAAGSAGFGWIISHISFLRKPFEALFGDANSIMGSSNGWGRTGGQLGQLAEQLRQASKKETGQWTGVAADAYRRAANTQATGLDALAQVSKAIGETVKQAGQLLAEVRDAVLDFINKCVRKVIQIIIEALAKSWLSFGASIAEGIARSVAEAVQTASKIAQKVQKFVSSLQKIIQAVQKIVQLAKSVKQLLATIGGKAAGSPAAVTQQAPQINTGTLDTAANAQYSQNSQNNASYGGTQQPAYGGYQNHSGNGTNTASYGGYQQPAYGGYQNHSGNGANSASYGGYQQPGYGGYRPPTGGGSYVPPGSSAPVPNPVSQVTPPDYGPSGPPPTPGAPASMVDRARWIGAAVEVLVNHGVDPSKIDAGQIAQVVDRTSGGNPHAIDMSAPSAGEGNPPKGLLQITDTQFQQDHIPGYDNIWEPVDNMLAGISGILREWGSIMALLQTMSATSGTSQV